MPDLIIPQGPVQTLGEGLASVSLGPKVIQWGQSASLPPSMLRLQMTCVKTSDGLEISNTIVTATVPAGRGERTGVTGRLTFSPSCLFYEPLCDFENVLHPAWASFSSFIESRWRPLPLPGLLRLSESIQVRLLKGSGTASSVDTICPRPPSDQAP